MTRISQSAQSQADKISQLEAENERLRALVEKDGQGERMSTLKCGVCLEIKTAGEFLINTPCGHCFCQNVNIFNLQFIMP